MVSQPLPAQAMETSRTLPRSNHCINGLAIWRPTSTRLGTRHQALPRLHVLGLMIARPFLEALAHLVSTPFHAGGVGSIVVAAPRLGLSLGLLLGLGRLLIPAGLPSYAYRSPHRGPYGRSLPGIAANGPPNSPNGRATARAA